MSIPENAFAVATFVIIALPGLVHMAVSQWARGELAGDRDLGLSVARGAVFALTLTAVYLVLFDGFERFGVDIEEGDPIITDPRRLAAIVLVFYILVPTIYALLVQRRHLEWKRVSRGPVWTLRSRHGYSSTPSPWDHAARAHAAAWLKIRRGNGDWIGGWVTKGSFISAYPEPRAVYIDKQFTMNSDGSFGAEIPGTGVFLTIREEDVVIWTHPHNEKERTHDRQAS